MRRLVPRSVRHGISAQLARVHATRLAQDLGKLAAGSDTIVAGPWLGEVGFELLYWVPFLRWFAGTFRVAPQRLLIDFLAIAPLVTIAFIAAACHIHRGPNWSGQCCTLLLAAGILVVHSLVPSKNLRFVVTADPFMRLLVASWLPGTRSTAAALVGNAIVEMALFYHIFIRYGVYDPVTSQLMRALKMVP